MIHQYKLNGYHIVLDICSGSVHAVDELAYDMIAGFETTDRAALFSAMAEKHPDADMAEIEECYQQIVELKESGALFTDDTFAPMAGELKA